MKHGTIKKAASKFGLHRNTISLIWNRIQQKIREGRTDFGLSPRKKVTNGPKLMTKKNEIQRLKFALSFVNPNGQFHGMFDYIHIV